VAVVKEQALAGSQHRGALVSVGVIPGFHPAGRQHSVIMEPVNDRLAIGESPHLIRGGAVVGGSEPGRREDVIERPMAANHDLISREAGGRRS